MRIFWSILALAAALPAWAQSDRLVGAWETTEIDSTGKITGRINLMSDGTFGMTVQGEVSTEELQGEGGPNLFPDGLTIAFEGNGSWRSDGDSLWVDMQQFDYRINDLSFEEFLATLIDLMLQTLAQSGEIPEDQLPQFEQMLRDEFATQFSREEFEQQFMGEVSGELLGAQRLAYALDGDVLTTYDEEGQATQWRKASINSAVSRVSWGRVKAGWQ
jgi:hypothetical protein